MNPIKLAVFETYISTLCLVYHSMEKPEIHFHGKIFRETNFLVTYSVSMLLSRNFSEKSVRVDFHNFHSAVHSAEITGILSHAFVAKIS